MITSRQIHVHFMRRGVHCYPAAAIDPELKTGDKYDVSYLASPHAHDFWFSVKVSVDHNERDLELIQFRERLSDMYGDGTLECGSRSVETLAEELIEKIQQMYPGRSVEVGVYEDSLHGNGAILYAPAE